MKREKKLLRLIVFGLVLFLFIGFSPVKNQCFGVELYRISTASMGGNLYRLTAAISKALNEEIKDAQFLVTTGSPKENVLFVEDGRAPIGATSPQHFTDVHPDDPGFKKTRLRALWITYPGLYYIVVPEKSPWQTLDDLKGKKISVGIKTGEGGVFTRLLKSIGWTDKDVKKFFYIGKTEGIAAYKDRTVDAWAGWSGAPSPIIMELGVSKRGARVIPFKTSEMEKIEGAFPFFRRLIIPAGSNKEIKKDCLTFSTWYQYIVRDDFSEDMAYKIAKAIDTRLGDISAAFKPFRTSGPDKVVKYSFFKIHPGVMKYLKEKGVVKSN